MQLVDGWTRESGYHHYTWEGQTTHLSQQDLGPSHTWTYQEMFEQIVAVRSILGWHIASFRTVNSCS